MKTLMRIKYIHSRNRLSQAKEEMSGNGGQGQRTIMPKYEPGKHKINEHDHDI